MAIVRIKTKKELEEMLLQNLNHHIAKRNIPLGDDDYLSRYNEDELKWQKKNLNLRNRKKT